MNVYRREVMICATAYIKASSPDAADAALRKVEGLQPIIHPGDRNESQDGDIPVFGGAFDSPRMPKVSLSPAMTIHGHWPGSKIEDVA